MFFCYYITYSLLYSSLSIWTASVATSGGGGGEGKGALLLSDDVDKCPRCIGDFGDLSSDCAGHSKWTQWNTCKCLK